MRLAFALALVAAPVFGADDTKGDLAELIETLGAHQTDTMRHAVEINDCQMTIFFWKDRGAHRLALHSVHHIDLGGYNPIKERGAKSQIPWFSIGESSEVLLMEMRPPNRLQSELAMRSNPSPPHRPSTREDIDTFVIRDRLFHGLRFDDLPEPGRMAALGEMIDKYHREYCITAG